MERLKTIICKFAIAYKALNFDMGIERIKTKLLAIQDNATWRNSLVEKKKLMNPVMSIEEIAQFENNLGIVLPVSYREFILKIGNGGIGPAYGLLSFQEAMIDFKLETLPTINLSKPFRYAQGWNEHWVFDIDWENGERPSEEQLEKYMSVEHLDGCLQIAHIGHGCTYLLVLNGSDAGYMWTDDRADYGGINPLLDSNGNKMDFMEWYMGWLNQYV